MAMIQQLVTNLTPSVDVTMTTQDVGVLTLSNRLKKLEAIVDVQNSSILEMQQTFNNIMFYNHTDTIEHLEKNLNDQNSTIHTVNERVLQMKSEHELDRNIVTELKTSVRLIEENVTTNAIILQNYSSHLNELDQTMTSVTDMIQIQYNNHEQLKENMTAYNIESLDHDSRIGQIELSHLSEITLNEEQKTQINELEEEINKTWIAIQGFGEGSTDRAGRGSDRNIGHFVKITAIL